MRRPPRALTTLATAVLLLDAVLLVWGGIGLGRPGLVVLGAVFALLAILVMYAWRRYRRTLEELEDARREMRQEVESIRELLHRHHLNN